MRIFKKLNMKVKKLKKTENMLNTMIKTVYNNITKSISYKNIIINIKGTKSNLFKILLNL